MLEYRSDAAPQHGYIITRDIDGAHRRADDHKRAATV